MPPFIILMSTPPTHLNPNHTIKCIAEASHVTSHSFRKYRMDKSPILIRFTRDQSGTSSWNEFRQKLGKHVTIYYSGLLSLGFESISPPSESKVSKTA